MIPALPTMPALPELPSSPASPSSPSKTGVSRRAVLTGAGALGLLGLTAPARLAAPAHAATGLVSGRLSAYQVHAWDGDYPTVNGSDWSFGLPALASPPSSRRSEVWWAWDGRPCSYGPGRIANYQATIRAGLGAAAASAQQWHVLWQLHGTTAGVWKGPAMILVVSGGVLRMGGGNGHPDHNPGAGRNYMWAARLVPYVDGRPYAVRIQSYLSPDPAQGWINAWVDGVQILNRYRPTSPTGLQPGTIYPQQPTVYSRSGLYRGSNYGSGPTYRQWAVHSAPLPS